MHPTSSGSLGTAAAGKRAAGQVVSPTSAEVDLLLLPRICLCCFSIVPLLRAFLSFGSTGAFHEKTLAFLSLSALLVRGTTIAAGNDLGQHPGPSKHLGYRQRP
jgi:hypothetical protein